MVWMVPLVELLAHAALETPPAVAVEREHAKYGLEVFPEPPHLRALLLHFQGEPVCLAVRMTWNLVA